MSDFRNFFANVYSTKPEPGLLYWIDVHSYMFSFLAFMLFEPVRTAGGFAISAPDLQDYLLRGLAGLNRFCESSDVSPEPSSSLIFEHLKDDETGAVPTFDDRYPVESRCGSANRQRPEQNRRGAAARLAAVLQLGADARPAAAAGCRGRRRAKQRTAPGFALSRPRL